MSSHQKPAPLILLVEDSEDDAFFFRWTIERSTVPCEIEHASDGALAVRYLEDALEGSTRRPDMVFLDLKLPTLSGFEVLEWIRAQNFDPPLEVAVLSGSEHASDVARARALGATAYYVKPLSPVQLRERLTAWQQVPTPDFRAEHAAVGTDTGQSGSA